MKIKKSKDVFADDFTTDLHVLDSADQGVEGSTTRGGVDVPASSSL